MADLYKHAARGRRDALDALYQSKEKLCWFLCVHLLSNANAASKLYVRIWENVFAEVRRGGILGQQQFDRLLLRETAQRCYAEAQRRAPEYFRCSVDSVRPQSADTLCLETIIAQLPPVERFVFLLEVVGKMDAYDCGKGLHLKRHAYHTALAFAANYMCEQSLLSKEALASQLSAAVEATVIPQETETAIYRLIARFGRKTLWERYKHLLTTRTLFLVTVFVAGLSLFLSAVLLTYWYIFTTK